MQYRVVLAVVLVLLALSNAAAGTLQDQASQPTATVSGRVTSQGKPLAGATVILVGPDARPERGVDGRATTGADGTFTIAGVRPGSYRIGPFVPAAVVSGVADGEVGRHVSVGPGDAIEGLEFEVIPGGVITGRVTNEAGEPLIREDILLFRVQENGGREPVETVNWQAKVTDDRGIFRVFGLGPGRYVVGAGQPSDSFMGGFGKAAFEARYWPGVERVEEAEAIEIVGGDEHRVEIRLGATSGTYSISGRVVEADGGAPVKGVGVMMGPVDADGNFTSYVGGWSSTGPRGEFEHPGVRPGRYGLVLRSWDNPQSYFAGTVVVEVRDADVSGVEVRASRGASVQGTVVFDATPDDVRAAALATLRVFCGPADPDRSRARMFGSTSARVDQDGSFTISGIEPGRYRFGFGSWDTRLQVSLARVERDGGPVDAIEIAGTETVSGIRLVAVYANGAIRGSVRRGPRATDQPVTHAELSVALVGGDETSRRSIAVDERGAFLVENLSPGQYEVRARLPRRGGPEPEYTVDAKVVGVANGAVVDVQLVLPLDEEDGK
jgi:hypothetical protein